MTVDGDGGGATRDEKARDRQPVVEVINVWSGPRSLSTSLMYSFAQVLYLSQFETDFSHQTLVKLVDHGGLCFLWSISHFLLSSDDEEH
jgi:hypothetical protein